MCRWRRRPRLCAFGAEQGSLTTPHNKRACYKYNEEYKSSLRACAFAHCTAIYTSGGQLGGLVIMLHPHFVHISRAMCGRLQCTLRCAMLADGRLVNGQPKTPIYCVLVCLILKAGRWHRGEPLAHITFFKARRGPCSTRQTACTQGLKTRVKRYY